MEAKVFNLFFALLLDQLEKEKEALSYKMDLFDAVMKNKELSQPVRKAFRERAIDATRFSMVHSISEKEMRTALDVAYDLLCDKFGPIAADGHISFVVDKIENHPDSADYPIRNYL